MWGMIRAVVMRHIQGSRIWLLLDLSALMVLTGGLFQASAQLADSPWPVFGPDAQRTGRSPYTGPEFPAEKWSVATGELFAALLQ